MKYAIYQVKRQNPDGRMFMDSRWHTANGIKISASAYECTYQGQFQGDMDVDSLLDGLWAKFNVNRPADFKGHSLSVSDVVVLSCNGIDSAYFCDYFGWSPVPGFFEG